MALRDGNEAAVNGSSLARAGSLETIQLINEDSELNRDLSKFLVNEGVQSAGHNYQVVSVFGSQSSGKSTLLNHLFKTDFNVMKPGMRCQTTRGIWLAKNKLPGLASNILVMDVEGADGQERGDDQIFERKSSLFALAVSDVVIINVFQTSIGLYSAGHMPLFQMVLQAHLNMFGTEEGPAVPTVLLIVIRDYVNTSTVSDLGVSIVNALEDIWNTIRQKSGSATAKFEKYFLVRYHGLPPGIRVNDDGRIFSPPDFIGAVDKLRARFVEEKEIVPDDQGERLTDAKNPAITSSLFWPQQYRMREEMQKVLAEDFPLHVQTVWEKVASNADFKLPDQLTLLAQHRCKEISQGLVTDFEATIQPFRERQDGLQRDGSYEVIDKLGPTIAASWLKALDDFSSKTKQYRGSVVAEARTSLEEGLNIKINPLASFQYESASRIGLDRFASEMRKACSGHGKKKAFDLASKEQQKLAIESFTKVGESMAAKFEDHSPPWSSYETVFNSFVRTLTDKTTRLRVQELNRVRALIEKKTQETIQALVDAELATLHSTPSVQAGSELTKTEEREFWDRIWAGFVERVRDGEARLRLLASSYGCHDAELDEVSWDLRRNSWIGLKQKLKTATDDNSLQFQLSEIFNSRFSKDQNGLPRVWSKTDKMESIFSTAQGSMKSTLNLLTQFKLDKTSSWPELPTWLGEAPPNQKDDPTRLLIGGVDDPDATVEDEMTVIAHSRLAAINSRLGKAMDGAFMAAKQSTQAAREQAVPLPFYLLLILLGWNEFYAVVTNPMLTVLLLLLASVSFVVFKLGLAMPLIEMSMAASRQGVDSGKAWLREMLQEDARPPQPIEAGSPWTRESQQLDGRSRAKRTETIELADLSHLSTEGRSKNE